MSHASSLQLPQNQSKRIRAATFRKFSKVRVFADLDSLSDCIYLNVLIYLGYI